MCLYFRQQWFQSKWRFFGWSYLCIFGDVAMLLLTIGWGYSGAAGLEGGVALTSSLCPRLWRISWGLYGPLSGTPEGYHDYLYPAIPLHQIFRRLAVLSSGLTPRWATTRSWVEQDVKRKLVSWADFNFTVFFSSSTSPIGAPAQSSATWWLIDIGACQSGGLLLWSGVLLTHTPRWRRMRRVRFLWSSLAKNRGSRSRSSSKLIVGQMWATGALNCFSRVQKREKREAPVGRSRSAYSGVKSALTPQFQTYLSSGGGPQRINSGRLIVTNYDRKLLLRT